MTCSYGTWFIHLGHDLFIWDMTHLFGTWVACCKALLLVVCLFIRTYIHMGHGSCIWDMTRAYGTWLVHMGHDSFIWHMTRSQGHGSFVEDMSHSFGAWLVLLHAYCLHAHTHVYTYIHSCGTRLVHWGHDSFIWYIPRSYETWLVHRRHALFLCSVTRSASHRFVCVHTHVYTYRDSHRTLLVRLVHDSYYIYIYM